MQVGNGILVLIFFSFTACFITNFVKFSVVLSGAHTIGHVHASGYNGHPGADMTRDATINAWDQTPTLFDNGYFVQLLEIVIFVLIITTGEVSLVIISFSLGPQSTTTMIPLRRRRTFGST